MYPVEFIFSKQFEISKAICSPMKEKQPVLSASLITNNELYSVPSVRPTKQSCLLPGREYEEVRGL